MANHTRGAWAMHEVEYPLGTWIHQGACRGLAVEIFFDKPHIEWAREICIECPVMLDCAKWAVDNEIPFGVWGGLSAQDRGFRANGKKGSP